MGQKVSIAAIVFALNIGAFGFIYIFAAGKIDI